MKKDGLKNSVKCALLQYQITSTEHLAINRMVNDRDNFAVVLGLHETGLAVGKSLGKSGIKVYGLDVSRNIGFYSKYIEASICSNPLLDEEEFLSFIINLAMKHSNKPVLFVTSDDFLKVVSSNRDKLLKYYLFNLPNEVVLDSLFDKHSLHSVAIEKDIPVPNTYRIESLFDIKQMLNSKICYPLFLKGLDVNEWRRNIDGSRKGFVVRNDQELERICVMILERNITFIAQEIIEGPDTNHFKVCVYYSGKGVQLLNFTLRKIRQNPVHFGVGAVVESIEYPELAKLGTELFDKINYKGVGSAEFKLDKKDNKLKLIEVNPRYWQQNYLATVCGMNFALVDYLEATGQKPGPVHTFRTNVKWVNRYMDFDSFLSYRKEGILDFGEWRRSLRGRKVYSDFSWNDPLPALYEILFSRKMFRIPKYIFGKLSK